MTNIFTALLGLIFFTSCKATHFDYVFVSDRDETLDLYLSLSDKQVQNIKRQEIGRYYNPDPLPAMNLALLQDQCTYKGDTFSLKIINSHNRISTAISKVEKVEQACVPMRQTGSETQQLMP